MCDDDLNPSCSFTQHLWFSINENSLHLQPALDALKAQLPPLPRLLYPTKRGRERRFIHAVDADSTTLQPVGEAKSLIDIVCENTGV